VRWRRQFTREKDRLRWSGPNNPPGMRDSSFRFSPDGDGLSMFIPDQAQWTFLDVGTGATQKTVQMLDAGTTITYLSDPIASRDARRLLTHALLHEPANPLVPAWLRRWLPARARFSSLTLVHDDSGQELLRLKINGRSESHLSPDGQLVLTCSFPSGPVEPNRIHAWTVPPGRPWLWIVGIPLAVGAGLLMLRGLRGWWRRARGRRDIVI
jgi:hypothetical protein